jgi:hypothetical protein
MYAIEFQFTLEREGVMPSSVALEESFRRNGERENVHVEHVSVNWRARDVHVVAFATAKNEAEARRFARIVGEAVAAELESVRFCQFQIWRDDRL